MRERFQAHRVAADDPGGDDPGEHQAASGEGVEGELHCCVFAQSPGVAGVYQAWGRSPDRDEEILWDDGDFVEDEEQQQIEAEKDAVDAADQGQVEGEELSGAVLDVPGEKNAGGGCDPGQQDED